MSSSFKFSPSFLQCTDACDISSIGAFLTNFSLYRIDFGAVLFGLKDDVVRSVMLSASGKLGYQD